MKLLKNYWPILLLMLGMVPAGLPLLLHGFYEPHDLHHLADIHQMYRAFQTGQLPPRLGPDFAWGFGYPLFHFYYVLPFYLGALFYWFFGSLTWAFKLVFVTSILLSVYGMYAFLRLYFSKISSFAGAFLYLYTPYRAVQLYVRGAMGEALSIALLPWVAWALVRLVRRKQKSLPVFSLVLGAYLLTHNYLWVLATPLLGVLALVELSKQRNKFKTLGLLAFSALTSLAMTSYWWLPAILDQGLVAEKTPFLLVDHFPFIKQLLLPSWGYGSSAWGPGDGLSFQLGIVNIVTVVLLVVLLILKKFKIKALPLAIIAIFGFITSIFFMNIRSYFIWQAFPFYDFIQFPWRLLFLTGFFSALAASVIISNIKPKKLFSLIFIFCALALTLNYFKPSKIVFNSDQYYLDRFFNDPRYSEDYLLLPKWTRLRPTSKPANKFELESGEIISVSKKSDINYEIELVAGQNDRLIFYAYYFPGWSAEIEGQAVEIEPQDPYGHIGVALEEGRHVVNIYWHETRLRILADLTSISTFLGVILVFGMKGRSSLQALGNVR